jgi:hypothetical protein
VWSRRNCSEIKKGPAAAAASDIFFLKKEEK